MGGGPSSLSPSPGGKQTEEIVFRCMEPMYGWWLVSPAVCSDEELCQHLPFEGPDGQEILPEVPMQFLELQNLHKEQSSFRAMRSREDVARKGEFSVMFCLEDMPTRFYPFRNGHPVEIYMCEQIICPTNERLHNMAYVVVVVEKRQPRDNPLRSFGDMIFGSLLGETENQTLPRQRFSVCTFDEKDNVDMISSSNYTVRIEHVE